MMNRIDVHNHFLPGMDDGCVGLDDSFACIQAMVQHGYDRFFLTPHTGCTEYGDVTPQQTRRAVEVFQREMDRRGVAAQFRPGGELRLSPQLLRWDDMDRIPTYGLNTAYCLADSWEPDWPHWADEAIDFLQGRGLTVILAHPERMDAIRANPALIETLADRGVLFQGNLGPLGGSEPEPIRALAEQFLTRGLYFMLGSDCHRPDHLPTRLAGLERAVELVGRTQVCTLTQTNPAKLWV